MENHETQGGMGCLYAIFSLLTAMIGYAIHHSIFWAIIDFIFVPFAWLKWIICQEVTLSVIKSAFSWFFK
jgi:hypothetical protein